MSNCKVVRRLLIPCCSLLLSFGIVLSDDSETLIDRSYQVIGIYLFHFAEFTRWPDSAFAADDRRLVLCIHGVNPFGGTLFNFNGDKVGDRTLFIYDDVSVEDVTQCHILFITRMQAAEMRVLLNRVRNRSVLVLSAMDHFIERGGMVGFYVKNSRIRFRINMREVTRANLSISSKLLRLAEVVENVETP